MNLLQKKKKTGDKRHITNKKTNHTYAKSMETSQSSTDSHNRIKSHHATQSSVSQTPKDNGQVKLFAHSHRNVHQTPPVHHCVP